MLKRSRKQKGFTIIELVIVIIILGILAAFAVPRFMGLAESARASAIHGLEGSLKAAAALAHAKQLADGSGPDVSITFEGQTVTMKNRYPTADSLGITKALQEISGFTADAGGATPGATITYTKTGADTPASCIVTYTNPATLGNPPTVTPTTTGC